MKNLILAASILMTAVIAEAQTGKPLSIEECYTLAKQNYPLVKQRELIEKSETYSVENISKGYLPQVNINGQATYQSDVTEIPIKLPGVNVPTVPKDQYKVYGEITQPITDLITVKQQKEFQKINSSIQEENLEVEIYKLKDRVNQLFFGILLIDEQVKQNELLKKDIQTGITKINAAIANGIDFKSSSDKLKAELLKLNQRNTELRSSRKAYIEMLGLFTNQDMDENTILEQPGNVAVALTVNRPELTIFDSKNKGYDIQKKLATTKVLPKFGLFFQGGLGQPSPVNLLSNDLSTYYIGGVRLNWSLSGFYTVKKEKRLIDLDRKMNDIQKETFLFNTNFTMKQQNEEITKLQELLKSDDEIVDLRVSIKNTANTQLENGVITTNDFLREINAEDQARQNRVLHQVQLLMAQYNYQFTTGN